MLRAWQLTTWADTLGVISESAETSAWSINCVCISTALEGGEGQGGEGMFQKSCFSIVVH